MAKPSAGVAGSIMGISSIGAMRAGVLVVLRAVAAGVVAQEDDQPAVHGRQVQRHERVDHRVHADALGADQRPAAGDRHADADLHGHLLVARPLDVEAVRSGQLDQDLDRLGAGRARVAGHHLYPGSQGTLGQGLSTRDRLQRHGVILRARALHVPTICATDVDEIIPLAAWVLNSFEHCTLFAKIAHAEILQSSLPSCHLRGSRMAQKTPSKTAILCHAQKTTLKGISSNFIALYNHLTSLSVAWQPVAILPKRMASCQACLGAGRNGVILLVDQRVAINADGVDMKSDSRIIPGPTSLSLGLKSRHRRGQDWPGREDSMVDRRLVRISVTLRAMLLAAIVAPGLACVGAGRRHEPGHVEAVVRRADQAARGRADDRRSRPHHDGLRNHQRQDSRRLGPGPAGEIPLRVRVADGRVAQGRLQERHQCVGPPERVRGDASAGGDRDHSAATQRADLGTDRDGQAEHRQSRHVSQAHAGLDASLPTCSAPADKAPAALESTVVLDEHSNYLNHLNQLRRVNAGDDLADRPGYGLYLVRIPVTLSPGPRSRRGKGAIITVSAKSVMTKHTLRSALRNAVVNETVNNLTQAICSQWTQRRRPDRGTGLRTVLAGGVRRHRAILRAREHRAAQRRGRASARQGPGRRAAPPCRAGLGMGARRAGGVVSPSRASGDARAIRRARGEHRSARRAR